MPVSSVTLTVSHLPTSTSFYLAALQPLDYEYIDQWGNQIGLGVDGEADFFLTQEGPGLPAGNTHVAFDASTRAAVHNFFAAALAAGATPHGAPGARYGGDSCFNAAVLDPDGNSVEVVFHEPSLTGRRSSAGAEARSVIGRGGVLDGASTIVDGKKQQYSSKRSVISRSNRSSTGSIRERERSGLNVGLPESQSSAENVLATLQKSMSGVVPSGAMLGSSNISISTKALAGTLLGAAAGAAVAYAMVQSEQDSARLEDNAAMFEEHMLRNRNRRRSTGNEDAPRPAPRSRRNSFRRIEAEPLPDMIPVGTQTFMNLGTSPRSAAGLSRARENAIEYAPFITSGSPGRSPSVLSGRSARRPSEVLERMDPIPIPSPSPSIMESKVSRAQSVIERVSSAARSIIDRDTSGGRSVVERESLGGRSIIDRESLGGRSVIERGESSKARSVTESSSPKARTVIEREIPKSRSSAGSSAKSETSSRHSKKASSSTSSHRSKHTTQERAMTSLPDISENEMLASRSSASRHSRASRSSRKSKHSSSSRRHSDSIHDETEENDDDNFVIPGGVSSEDDHETVVPSDSISCIGTSPSRVSKGSKHRSHSGEHEKKTKSSRSSAVSDKHRRYAERDDIHSEPPIHKGRRHKSSSDVGSEITITPSGYKERSVTSMPIRGMVVS